MAAVCDIWSELYGEAADAVTGTAARMQMQAQMQQQQQNMYQTMQLGGLGNMSTTYCLDTMWGQTSSGTTTYTQKGDPVPQYIYQEGKMRRVQNWEEEVDKEIQKRKNQYYTKKISGTIELDNEEEEKVEVKLTLSEARHLEEACEKDSELKDILAKIEKEVDFTIVVSFRDDKSK